VTLARRNFLNILKPFVSEDNVLSNNETENTLAEACLEENFILQLDKCYFTIRSRVNYLRN
jgi:hypothetical protein